MGWVAEGVAGIGSPQSSPQTPRTGLQHPSFKVPESDARSVSSGLRHPNNPNLAFRHPSTQHNWLRH